MIWLINAATRTLGLLILLRVAVSWLSLERKSEYFRLLHLLTEPFLAPLRRVFYWRGMGFDLSPLVALICLEALRGLLVAFLR